MTPHTILVRARDIQIRIGDADDVVVIRGDLRIPTTPHALTVLAAFAQPRPVAGVLEGAATGSQDWIELSSTVHQLARAGILIEPGAPEAAPRGYALPPIHVAMLDDEARTRGFVAALRSLVREGDSVLDIGTGTGVLATVAALAGARHVTAIESNAIADSASRVFVANGVSERVTLVRGRSTTITLPSRCDVLVTEIIGNDPLDEHLLDVVADAKERLLTPDARLIPCAIEVFAFAVDVPLRYYERREFTDDRLAAWREAYGVDFSPLRAVRSGRAQPLFVRTSEILSWPRVAAPTRLASIDFARPFDRGLRKKVPIALERDVERLGIALAFRATLAPGIVLSTLPDEVSPTNHWRYALWPSHDRPTFGAGTAALLDYDHSRGETRVSIS